MSILLSLGSVQLLETLAGEILSQGISDILLGEEYMHACEAGIIGSHAIILQSGYGVHALLRHILLGEHDGELLGSVVAIVEEDDHIPFLDGSIHSAVVDRLHELVCDTLIITLLHSLNHVGSLLSLCLDEQVIGHLDTFPSLVTVHRIEASYHTGYGCSGNLGAMVSNLLDEALTTLGVGISAIHETVHKCALDAISLADIKQCEEVVKRGVYTTVAGETHQVHILTIGLGVFVGRHYLGILQDAPIGTGAVDLHQILINDASGTYVQVSYLRVTHLSVGQTYVLSARKQLAVGIVLL